MNILDEIQAEINKADKISEDVKSNIQRRQEKLRNKLNTSSDDAKLKFGLDNLLNNINNLKIKYGDKLDDPKIKNQINKLWTSYGDYKKQIEKMNNTLIIANDFNVDGFNHNKNRYNDNFHNEKTISRQEYEQIREQKLKGMLKWRCIFYLLF